MDPKEIISGKRILIVDDEQDVLDTLQTFWIFAKSTLLRLSRKAKGSLKIVFMTL